MKSCSLLKWNTKLRLRNLRNLIPYRLQKIQIRSTWQVSLHLSSKHTILSKNVVFVTRTLFRSGNSRRNKWQSQCNSIGYWKISWSRKIRNWLRRFSNTTKTIGEWHTNIKSILSKLLTLFMSKIKVLRKGYRRLKTTVKIVFRNSILP